MVSEWVLYNLQNVVKHPAEDIPPYPQNYILAIGNLLAFMTVAKCPLILWSSLAIFSAAFPRESMRKMAGNVASKGNIVFEVHSSSRLKDFPSSLYREDIWGMEIKSGKNTSEWHCSKPLRMLAFARVSPARGGQMLACAVVFPEGWKYWHLPLQKGKG